MYANWMAALACGGALVLAACSGAPATTTGTTSPTEPTAPPPEQPVDPPATDRAEDTRTQPQKDFDDSLERARDGLATARADVSAAVAAAAAARTDAARTQAQTDIANARTALTDAVNAAKALAELSSDPGRLGARAIFVEAAEAARTEDLAKLLRAEAGTGWARDVAAGPPPSLIPAFAEDAAVRRLRKNEDGDDAATLLKMSDIPPIIHSSGKVVIGGNLGNSPDRLHMRGMPITAYGNSRLQYAFGLNTDATQSVVENLAAIRNNRSDLVAGLRITPAGLVVDMGGKNAAGVDFRVDNFSFSSSNLLRAFPGDANTGLGKGYDLALDFGKPAASPEGNAEHYWTKALEPTAGLVTAAGGDSGWLKDGGKTLPLGVYEVRLSNHIGFDANQEDPDAGEPYTADDENHYLTYAAYGFMDFFRPGTHPNIPNARHGYQRVFPFHVGYDAFKDVAGRKTTDIGEAAITSGTFKGRTMAVRFLVSTRGFINVTPELTTRMRGDIELTATISGTQADNTLTGTISNMEDWDPKGYWEDSSIMPADISLGTDGMIDAKGEFTGTFANFPPGYTRGGYRGHFYGPVESLEAAGTWAMSLPVGTDVFTDTLSIDKWAIAGSFGAAMVRGDGTYGRVVEGAEAPAGN